MSGELERSLPPNMFTTGPKGITEKFTERRTVGDDRPRMKIALSAAFG